MTCLLRLLLLLVIALPAYACSGTPPPIPARHGDFAHYTFALTWQPGFCGTTAKCLHQPSPHTLIGLHGLWASRPQSLIDAGITAPQWWRRGCDYFHHSNAAPSLSRATQQKLRAVMPQLRPSLLTHEYDKHVQCFGFDTQRFFDMTLAMRRRIVDSAFGHYLLHQARGQTVRRAGVIAAFMHSFGTDKRNALQLRCDADASGRVVLTQLWITLHSNAVAAFPHNEALMNAPIAQDNCPRAFLVPQGSR